MKFYTIKEEHLTSWTNDPSVTTDTIIDSDEVERLAREWNMDEDELLEQLDEVETYTATFRVYGPLGRLQRMSFEPSFDWDFTGDAYTGDKVRRLHFANADETCSNVYTDVTITCNTREDVLHEIRAQLTDGAFENVRTGIVREIVDGSEQPVNLW